MIWNVPSVMVMERSPLREPAITAREKEMWIATTDLQSLRTRVVSTSSSMTFGAYPLNLKRFTTSAKEADTGPVPRMPLRLEMSVATAMVMVR